MRPRELKNKINLTQNILGVTQALELISAVKMKKAIKLALGSRPFARKVISILIKLSREQKALGIESLYFKPKEPEGAEKILVLVMASDRGFCGLYNKNILKFAEQEIRELKKEGEVDPVRSGASNGVEIIALGKKAVDYFKKRSYKIKSEFLGAENYGKLENSRALTELIFNYYKKAEYQKIYFYCTHYSNPFFQPPRKIQILPLDAEKLEEMLKKLAGESVAENKAGYIFEPSFKEIVGQMVLQLMEFEIYHAILEALASEHTSRMFAMKRAMDNAKEIIKGLTLQYNKARQAQITAEVSEITSAKEATV